MWIDGVRWELQVGETETRRAPASVDLPRSQLPAFATRHQTSRSGHALDHLPPDRAPTKAEWHELSELWRPRLEAKIATLEAIRDRLDSCIGCGCQSLDSCSIFNPDDIASDQGPGSTLTRH